MAESHIGSAGFIEIMKSLVKIGDRKIEYNNHGELDSERYDLVHVDFVNLPKDTPGDGGAEWRNNRMVFFIERFGKGPDDPPPKGKVTIEVASNAFGKEHKLRGKTAAPAVIAKYLADFLNAFVATVPPKYTHSRPR